MNLKDLVKIFKSPTAYIQKLVNERTSQQIDENLKKMNFRTIDDTEENDVFIVGFPKSGNTWMQHIVAHLFYNLNHHQSRNIIDLIVPDVHYYKYYNRLNNQCFFKSHKLPQKKYRRVIYIYRDGRDALLSYYHMQKNKKKDTTLSNYFKQNAQIAPCKWHEHITHWFKNPYESEILFIKYEDLIRLPFENYKAVAEFINVKYTTEFINYVIEQTSFNQMVSVERKDKEWWSKKQAIGWGSEDFFIRKGEIGNYKVEVPIELIEEFNTYSNEILEMLGYEL